MKYKILIIDDEESGRQSLKILLEKIFWAYIENISFSNSFESGQANILKSNYDIIFLDVNLKGISGFELLKHIKSGSRVVFVTAYSEFMLEALRNRAFDYLVKPVKESDLISCINRLVKESDADIKSTSIYIKSKGVTRILSLNDIIYVEGDGPYSILYTKEEDIKTARTIKSLLPDLSNGFIRIHKSYLVNRKYIKGFNLEKLILYNEKWLPVSRSGYKLLQQPS